MATKYMYFSLHILLTAALFILYEWNLEIQLHYNYMYITNVHLPHQKIPMVQMCSTNQYSEATDGHMVWKLSNTVYWNSIYNSDCPSQNLNVTLVFCARISLYPPTLWGWSGSVMASICRLCLHTLTLAARSHAMRSWNIVKFTWMPWSM